MTRFRARKCILGLTKFKFDVLIYFSQKNMKNYNGVWEGGELNNSLNRRKSGSV